MTMYNDYDDDEFELDDEDEYSRPDYDFEDALQALPLKKDGLIPAQILLGFSDLMPEELEHIRPKWQQQPATHRQIIMERLAEASESDFELDYAVFATLGYNDPDSQVRTAAIQAGWTDDTPETLNILMKLAKQDASVEVRAADRKSTRLNSSHQLISYAVFCLKK